MTAQQLKNSILQMAVQGKLVPQDPNDEPASVLLERIRTEKERLIKEKKIKKEKNSSVIFRGSDNFPYADLPFDVPESWVWVRLENICSSITDGDHQPPPQTSSGIPFLVISNVSQGYFDWSNTRFVSEEYYNNIQPQRKAEIGDILFTVTGSYGIPLVVENSRKFCFQRHIALIKPIIDNIDYLMMLLQSPLIKQQCDDSATGTAQKTVSLSSLRHLLLPLPPLAEQCRIVARIEKLLPYIADYAAAEQKLTALNAAFPSDLKKSILQAAVMGKLVPQDPADEPAPVLLERIRAEKEALIKAGKIKRDKRESVIFRRDNSHYTIRDGMEVCIDDDSPFEIPESWAWVHLGEICTVARGGSPRPIQEYLTSSENGINWIKIGDTDIGGKYINSTKQKIKPEGISKSRMVHRGDFLLTNSMSFGRPYILNVDGCIHDGWLVLSGYQATLDTDYFYYTLSSRFAYYQFCGQVSGAVVKNLNSDKVADSIFPLPPLAEQVRIVKRIDRLLGIIEKVPTA